MRKLIPLLLAVCAVTFAAATTGPAISFMNGMPIHVISDASPRCSTYAFVINDAPYVSLSWNAYGDSGYVYGVGVRWADASGHFDVRVETLLIDTLTVSDSLRTAARRHTQQFAVDVCEYGAAVFWKQGDSMTTAYIDSVRLVRDVR